MDDNRLAASAASGDAAAFGLLVRAHQSRLRGFLRRLTRGDHALADDLAQESFLEAWRKIGQCRGAFAGWLMRIGYSRYLMTARRRKLEPLEAAQDIALICDPDAKLDLEKAMARLSLPERAALTVCHALGYSNEEGAAILDMPLGTLKSHLLRGGKKLRAMLGEDS